MYRIYLETIVRATLENCFDLSRSIDFHKDSMRHTNEVPVDGRLSGLVEAGEFVEWEATHMFVKQRLSSRITQMVKPHYFVDEMMDGVFKSFVHKHKFLRHKSNEVLMIDDFYYEVPLGILGSIANVLFLRRYMEKLIRIRNENIKRALETEEWKRFLAT
jgi:ligand-binding SRPBCC domain-containing protein